MSIPDDFESEGGTVTTTGPETKFYQVSVPNFAQSSDPDNVVAGSSFIRLGSFPAKNDASAPAGFPASFDLANLVGNDGEIQRAENADVKPEDSRQSSSYNGDPNYMLGFADDTRYRQGDKPGDPDKTPPEAATWTARQKVSGRLLAAGGWWDHSDGNRISTTAGDKIEIIQGNYKMVVMGRQGRPVYPRALSHDDEKTYWRSDTQAALAKAYADKNAAQRDPSQWAPLAATDVQGLKNSSQALVFPSIDPTAAGNVAAKYDEQLKYNALVANSLITDVSGGMMVENGPAPTHCIKSIEFNASDTGGTYDVYQNNGVGNVYSSFYGSVGDVFFGPRKETWTGMAPDADYGGTSDFYKKALSLHPDPAALQANPTITDHTWAQCISTYKGSAASRIGCITDETWADRISSTTHGGTIVSTVESGAASIYAKVEDGCVTMVNSANAITSVNKAIDNFALTAAAFNWNMAFGVNHFNLTIGAQENIFFGPKLDIAPTPYLQYALDFQGWHNIRRDMAAQQTTMAGIQRNIAGLQARLAARDLNLVGNSTNVHLNSVFNTARLEINAAGPPPPPPSVPPAAGAQVTVHVV